MENKAKPRICEVLGVEVGELFTADYPYKDLGKIEVREDGTVVCGTCKVRSNALCYMINHPECIHKVRRWTPEEVELAKAIKIVWPTAYSIQQGPALTKSSTITIFSRTFVLSETIRSSRFPSLEPDEQVLLKDIIGDDENA